MSTNTDKPTKKFKIVTEFTKRDQDDLDEDLDEDRDEGDVIVGEVDVEQLGTEKNAEKNAELNQTELTEHQSWQASEATYPYLYPNLNDPQFNLKIAQKKEFADTRYDGQILTISEQAEKMCNAEFELAPHQQFIRNFLSFQTPYNSLLLYHGLGSGKTCSAIGVAEEMRDYVNQLGVSQRIIVVASPNVQENFRLQLFDESRLKQDSGGVWTIKTCTGSKLLREINPAGLSKEKIVSQVNRLINNSYQFMGYTEFANYIQRKSDTGTGTSTSTGTGTGTGTVKNKNNDIAVKNKLRQHFSNRLIIIDEVHNIRVTDDNKDKRVAKELYRLVSNVDNLRLLFLSATPLYNNYKEIIWLINIMNMNDGRSTIATKDVFDANGDFVEGDGDIGRTLLERKAVGYISYVRGDNPYTFPYRIWPTDFAPEKTVQSMAYPSTQLNRKPIPTGIRHIAVYITKPGTYQEAGYNQIVAKLSPDNLDRVETMDTLGYIQLQRPIEALNIVYPNARFDELAKNADIGAQFDVKELIGKHGLRNIMTYTETPTKTNFEYKPETLAMYGRIFAQDKIGKYSGKIAEICANIMGSVGVVLVYSQYLDGGLVPIALALEEMGLTRYGTTKSLFKTPPSSSSSSSMSGRYVMITGDKMLSPDNVDDLRAATRPDNTNGNMVKVILISQAGSEGLDFKFIRQVHILEPWYNMSRAEQIIGRAVRNCSHKDLPFELRNVELFLYGTQLTAVTEEAADLYVYRLAEMKTVQIGQINRVLKEVAVDCLLNSAQLNFTAEILQQKVTQVLSNGQALEYQVGDKPFSSQCDYMESCVYQCKPVAATTDPINELSYTEAFITMNNDNILHRIRQIFKDGYFFKKADLLKQINIIKPYPEIQIHSALNELITDKSELIADKYGRLGNLVNIGEYYLFQPQELSDEHVSLYERSTPIPYKHDKITVVLSEDQDQNAITKDQDQKTITKAINNAQVVADNAMGKAVLDTMMANYITATSPQKIVRGESDWYKYCSVVMTDLTTKGGIELAILDEFLVCHLIQTLLFNDLFNVINYVYGLQKPTEFEQKVRNYFKSLEMKTLTKPLVVGIMVHDWSSSSESTKESVKRLIVLRGQVWRSAEAEDYNDLLPIIGQTIVPINTLNNVVGFMSNFKNDYMVFKVKQLENKRNKGARCDQSSRPVILTLLNQIVKRDPVEEAKPGYKPPTNDYSPGEYTTENTNGLNSIYLCILQEFLLRLYNYDQKYGKVWFLDPTQAVLTKIEKIEHS